MHIRRRAKKRYVSKRIRFIIFCPKYTIIFLLTLSSRGYLYLHEEAPEFIDSRPFLGIGFVYLLTPGSCFGVAETWPAIIFSPIFHGIVPFLPFNRHFYSLQPSSGLAPDVSDAASLSPPVREFFCSSSQAACPDVSLSALPVLQLLLLSRLFSCFSSQVACPVFSSQVLRPLQRDVLALFHVPGSSCS